jgi:hypothetical protein
LVPANPPVLPLAGDPRYLTPWAGGQSSNLAGPSLFVACGWFSLERDGSHIWRWAGRRAELVIWRRLAQPETVVLGASLTSLARGRLTIRLNGKVLWEGVTSKAPVEIHDLSLVLRPGANHLVFSFSGELRRAEGDWRKLGVMVRDLSVAYHR